MRCGRCRSSIGKSNQLVFNQKSVFILGAGASWYYDYPTGEMLVTEVKKLAQTLSVQFSNHRTEVLGTRMVHASTLMQMLPKFINDIAENDPIKIDKALDDTIENLKLLHHKIHMSDPLVIDHFLCFNTDVAALARILIAAVLLQYENGPGHNRGNWYKYIIQKLMSGCGTAEDLLKNNVKFVTFNYDVSLEQKLYSGLEVNNIFSDKKTLGHFFTDDRFMHVYGKLRDQVIDASDLPLGKPSTYGFRKEQMDLAYRASKGIKTIDPTDKIEDLKVMTSASKSIEDAEVVYILGYGFDAENSKRLGINKSLRIEEGMFHEKNKKVFFTNYQDKNLINKRASELFFGNLKHFVPPKPAIEGASEGGAYYEKSTLGIFEALQNDFELI